jgi:hypothetical protein
MKEKITEKLINCNEVIAVLGQCSNCRHWRQRTKRMGECRKNLVSVLNKKTGETEVKGIITAEYHFCANHGFRRLHQHTGTLLANEVKKVCHHLNRICMHGNATISYMDCEKCKKYY